MSDFRIALLVTALPIIVLGAISAGGRIARAPDAFFYVGWVGAGLWGLALLACIGFALARKRQIALGILAGIGIGLVGLGPSCFAAISILEF